LFAALQYFGSFLGVDWTQRRTDRIDALPISRTRPVRGSIRFNRARIGPLFRSTDAVNQRPSSSFCPTIFSMGNHPEGPAIRPTGVLGGATGPSHRMPPP